MDYILSCGDFVRFQSIRDVSEFEFVHTFVFLDMRREKITIITSMTSFSSFLCSAGNLFSPLADALREMDLVLLPRGCAGCGQPDEVLCPSCAAAFHRPLQREFPRTLMSSGFCYSCCPYGGCVRHAILQWKDHDDVQVGYLFARFLSHLACTCIPSVCRSESRIAIVPAPSTRASIARRGRFHTSEISKLVCHALAHSRPDLSVRHICALGFRAGTHKSVKGTVHDRQSRSHTSIYVRPHAHRLLQQYPTVILVDDICTTGSTLLGCARVLRSAGFHVMCALTLAAVPSSQPSEEDGG
jgi:predicted amidophosphoribosyltransferase